MYIGFSSKLSEVWTSGSTKTKEQIQKLIFPNGIMYNCKTETFRTEKVNEVFSWMAKLVSITAEKEKGQTNDKVSLSCQVEMALPTSNQFLIDLKKINDTLTAHF